MNLHKIKHTSCPIRRSQLLNVCGWRCFCDNGSEMTLLPLLILSHLLAYVLDDNFICRAARMPLSVAHSHWLFIFVSLIELGDTARDGQ